MPAIPANANNFQLNSDFPLDKIVVLKSGSFTLPNNVFGHMVTIPHGLPFTPLCGGNYAFVSDFSVQYDYSTGPFPASVPGFNFDQTVNVFADGTNIYLSGDNVNSSSKTVYYRVYGFEQPESNSEVPSVASQGDNFLLNTGFNYPKLYLDSYADISATGASPQSITINHGIGAITQAMGWLRATTWNGTANVLAIHPASSTNSGSPGTLMAIYTDRIVFTTQPFAVAHRAYYRVYLDT